MENLNTAKKQKEIVVALVGNPNSGKTSLFNALTGARQHVGNWPGVTVEKKEGRLDFDGTAVRVIDLPGTYSLGAYSEDEVITRDYILKESPDVVINVIDSTNLERNLYLTVQLLEMHANVVLALNMFDEARAKKIKIDTDRLSALLDVPVAVTVATKNEGIKELIEKAISASKKEAKSDFRINYGREIEEEIAKIESIIYLYPEIADKYPPRWLAIKLLEEDNRILEEIKKDNFIKHVSDQLEKSKSHLIEISGEDAEIIIADRRYGFISGLEKEFVRRHQTTEQRYTLSDKIDKVVTNRYLGIPIFLFTMWSVFQFTFKLGDPMIGWVETLFEGLSDIVSGVAENIGAPDLVVSFVVNGVIGGVGSVLVFIPPIFLLFLAISILEDSGYMARAAYVMDRLMHALGLHGKSFIPLLIGFGCNVPGIMATRTLENRQDRLITILINPFMSCAARLPVYVLFAGAFFAEYQGWVIFSLYLLGIVIAIVMGKIFKKYLFKGETSHFVMELPPYRVPTLKGLFIHMWERGSSFIKKAGTIIFSVVVLIWALSNLPLGVEYASSESLIGRLGAMIAPVLSPAGFGTWQAAASLIFGILAKEVVVGTLAVLYGVEEAGLGEVIRQNFTPLSAYAFIVMTLLYIPCVATIGAIRRETNSWGWTAFAVCYSLILGWLMSVLIFQGGRFLGFS